jgi:hypothetical protein
VSDEGTEVGTERSENFTTGLNEIVNLRRQLNV